MVNWNVLIALLECESPTGPAVSWIFGNKKKLSPSIFIFSAATLLWLMYVGRSGRLLFCFCELQKQHLSQTKSWQVSSAPGWRPSVHFSGFGRAFSFLLWLRFSERPFHLCRLKKFFCLLCFVIMRMFECFFGAGSYRAKCANCLALYCLDLSPRGLALFFLSFYDRWLCHFNV